MIPHKLLAEEYARIVAAAKANPHDGYRRVTYHVEQDGIYVSESTVYRVLQQEGLLVPRKHRPAAGERYVQEPSPPDEMWATDITYVFVDGHGFDYLFTVLDVFSRYVLHWDLRPTMTSQDAREVVAEALRKGRITPSHRPSNLSKIIGSGTRLDVFGFKSFADKIETEFSPHG